MVVVRGGLVEVDAVCWPLAAPHKDLDEAPGQVGSSVRYTAIYHFHILFKEKKSGWGGR
jgi:hypothetical protein